MKCIAGHQCNNIKWLVLAPPHIAPCAATDAIPSRLYGFGRGAEHIEVHSARLGQQPATWNIAAAAACIHLVYIVLYLFYRRMQVFSMEALCIHKYVHMGRVKRRTRVDSHHHTHTQSSSLDVVCLCVHVALDVTHVARANPVVIITRSAARSSHDRKKRVSVTQLYALCERVLWRRDIKATRSFNMSMLCSLCEISGQLSTKCTDSVCRRRAHARLGVIFIESAQCLICKRTSTIIVCTVIIINHTYILARR